MSASALSGGLLERDAELEALGAAFSRAAEGLRAVLHVAGAAGIGKSLLPDAACELAGQRKLVC